MTRIPTVPSPQRAARRMAAVLALLAGPAAAQPVTFAIMPASGPRLPWGMSGSGNLLVGSGNFIISNIEAWIWAPPGAVQQLGLMDAAGRGASFDGSVVVGHSSTLGAWRWTGGVAQTMGATSTFPWSEINAISGNGAVVIGRGLSGSTIHAARWTSQAGLVDMGALPGANRSELFGVSRDGARMAGTCGFPGAIDAACLWTAPGAIQNLGTLPGASSSTASAISSSGAVVVGSSGSGPGQRVAYRWTEAGGMQSLGVLPGMPWSHATSVSSDGSLIVGTSYGRPFLWSVNGGLQDLAALLTASGINLNGLNFGGLIWISDDGRRLGGNGDFGQYAAAWAATIPQGFGCYANCDASTSAPVLNLADFLCFLNRFTAGDPYANCDNSTTPPVLNVLDFTCFLNRFAAGCP